MKNYSAYSAYKASRRAAIDHREPAKAPKAEPVETFADFKARKLREAVLKHEVRLVPDERFPDTSIEGYTLYIGKRIPRYHVLFNDTASGLWYFQYYTRVDGAKLADCRLVEVKPEPFANSDELLQYIVDNIEDIY